MAIIKPKIRKMHPEFLHQWMKRFFFAPYKIYRVRNCRKRNMNQKLNFFCLQMNNLAVGLNTNKKHNSWLKLVYIKTIRFEPEIIWKCVAWWNLYRISLVFSSVKSITDRIILLCIGNNLNFLHICSTILFEEALLNLVQSNYNSNVKLIWSTFHR